MVISRNTEAIQHKKEEKELRLLIQSIPITVSQIDFHYKKLSHQTSRVCRRYCVQKYNINTTNKHSKQKIQKY